MNVARRFQQIAEDKEALARKREEIKRQYSNYALPSVTVPEPEPPKREQPKMQIQEKPATPKERPDRRFHSETKARVSIWLEHDVIEAFKKGGPGWQTRINLALKEWIDRSG